MDWRFSWIVGGATLVGFLGNGLADRAGRRWPVQRKLVVVLALLTVASYAAAVDRALSLDWSLEMLKIFAMFLVATALLDSRYRLRMLAIVVVLTVGYVAADLNQRYVLQGQKAPPQFENLDNNGLAALMVMALPFCVLLFTQERRGTSSGPRWRRWC